MKVELDLSNYATKIDLKGVSVVGISNLAAKSDLANLKAEVDEKNQKTKNCSCWFKLSNIVDHNVVKKTVYDKVVCMVNNIDTSGLVLKAQQNTKKSVLEKKIDDTDGKVPDASELITKTVCNAKIIEVLGKMLIITDLAITSGLNAVENKIHNVSDLIKKNRLWCKKYQTLRLNISPHVMQRCKDETKRVIW